VTNVSGGTFVPPLGRWPVTFGRDVDAGRDRVMRTYGMMTNLSPEQERVAREKVTSHLAEKPEASEQAPAVEGLRCLRSVKEFS
jgi:hypothetical protein